MNLAKSANTCLRFRFENIVIDPFQHVVDSTKRSRLKRPLGDLEVSLADPRHIRAFTAAWLTTPTNLKLSIEFLGHSRELSS